MSVPKINIKLIGVAKDGETKLISETKKWTGDFEEWMLLGGECVEELDNYDTVRVELTYVKKGKKANK